MSEDLVKLLRLLATYPEAATLQAADRIEALEAERDKWHAGWMEAEAKISELEVERDALAEKLEKVVGVSSGLLNQWDDPYEPREEWEKDVGRAMKTLSAFLDKAEATPAKLEDKTDDHTD